MKKFNLYAGLKGKTELVETIEVENQEVASKVAEYHAYDVYYLNPVRDVMEIMKNENVNEDVAHILFITDMVASVEFSAEEVVE